MKKNILSIFVVFLFVIIFQSSDKVEKQNYITLKVKFSDYQKKSIRFEIMAEGSNVFKEEWHDTVKMRILSEGIWKDKTFTVIISEYPVREAFLNTKINFQIIIDQEKLLAEDSSGDLPWIYSGNMEFKK